MLKPFLLRVYIYKGDRTQHLSNLSPAYLISFYLALQSVRGLRLKITSSPANAASTINGVEYVHIYSKKYIDGPCYLYRKSLFNLLLRFMNLKFRNSGWF